MAAIRALVYLICYSVGYTDLHQCCQLPRTATQSHRVMKHLPTGSEARYERPLSHLRSLNYLHHSIHDANLAVLEPGCLIFQLPFFSSNMSRPALQLRILTFNIRYATSSPFTNEKPWSERFPRVLNQIQLETRFPDGSSIQPGSAPQHSAASVICLQEVLHSQLIDLLGALNEINISSDTPADGAGLGARRRRSR